MQDVMMTVEGMTEELGTQETRETQIDVAEETRLLTDV
jgi:hypothetical protein